MPRKRTPDERLAQTSAHRVMRTRQPGTLSEALGLLRSYTLNGRPVTVTPQRCAIMGYHQGYRFRVKGAGMSFSLPPDPRDAYAIPQPQTLNT